MSQQQMYQASDGKWYPVSAMPQGYQAGYGQGGNMQYGHQQPIYVQQPQHGGGGAAAAAGGTGCLAALCGALLCFNLGACLF